MKLNELFSGLPRLKGRKVLGRGLGCGKGKTSGKGHKGQKARAGCSIKGFEGGQQSIFTRLPKRGFRSMSRKRYDVVNLGAIQKLIEAGKIDSGAEINKETLVGLGVVSSRNKVKILGKGKLDAKVSIRCDAISRSAEGKVCVSKD
ncbi:50S ribosomal protein L15 [Candidatus Anaplasma sp. TIGMIC]|uniref:50S ribosomal protein L15 n=1 Tax=Candidatus Anaplasma sp. TIGMIC TaxID=3020713 RepID=UPI0023307A2F|nr:50S ribosomal protein L15 [Candidatus Anaplasma sp. TIGMIC]MDB1135242.1 50S ribosomal protein L15 [Candidatus Anaplasma sp. TIGMIC]